MVFEVELVCSQQSVLGFPVAECSVLFLDSPAVAVVFVAVEEFVVSPLAELVVAAQSVYFQR